MASEAPDRAVGGGTELLGSDAAVVHEAAAARSFDEFYRREYPRLVVLAHALAGSTASEDLAQESMIAAYRRWSEITTFQSPEAWVRRVCANQATSVLRRRGAEARALLRLGSRRQSPAVAPAYDAFWEEVRRLPRRQAQATALRYVYDLELADIARTMGCSDGAVKVHLSRARTALAMRLMPEEDPQ
jgi:RNA polymerase sigma-70 factor (ECF subfamily)